jgi:hypothetical protein
LPKMLEKKMDTGFQAGFRVATNNSEGL